MPELAAASTSIQFGVFGTNSVRNPADGPQRNGAVRRTPAQSCAEPADFSVMQPGSTVATALSEGEAAPKHAFMLEVNGEMFRTVQFALDTVRPFVFETVRTGGVL